MLTVLVKTSLIKAKPTEVLRLTPDDIPVPSNQAFRITLERLSLTSSLSLVLRMLAGGTHLAMLAPLAIFATKPF